MLICYFVTGGSIHKEFAPSVANADHLIYKDVLESLRPKWSVRFDIAGK